ncbi:diguanylate cyclase [Nodosilinea sp. LEGE 07298]|uniref:diguanylate cyclase domain-containing protein n=1 Tax=Nodosilinea sp. LEGE 07298 TaxID=2777970 RepID=UPI00187FE663|nr:diguanylate cyclase [Nodosilinea sp. LEGE 07298]MBE9110804.1 diguanylate cyclase [Nodosilinea sp. LEGE 07298]
MHHINQRFDGNSRDVDPFEHSIHAAVQRAETLYSMLQTVPQFTPELCSKALEGLHLTLEELQVAHEELQVQQEALAEKHEQVLLSHQRYQDLFEFSPEGALVTDGNGLILAVNQAFAHLIGVPQHWLMGKPLATFVPLDRRGRFRHWLQQVQEGAHTNRWETCLQRRDQVNLPVSISVRRCQAPYENELWWAVQDRRDRHAAESAIRMAQHQLEQKVQERTAALTEANQRLESEIAARQQAEQRLEFQAQQERLLQAMAQRIRSSLELDQVLTATVEEIQQLLKVDRVLILRFQADSTKTVATEAHTNCCQSLLAQTFREPCFSGQVLAHYCQRGVRAIADIMAADLEPCLVETLSGLNVRALLVVPILQEEPSPADPGQKDRVWGLLIAHHCHTPRPWHDHEQTLLLRLSTQVSIAIQQSALHTETQRLTVVDSLTQVANRRKFDTYLHRMWKQHLRDQTPLALMLADIDFFKLYNDTYGHQGGDRCLQTIATSLKQQVKRPQDIVARYGGEEFAAILPQTNLAGAQQLAETCLAHIQSLNLPHPRSPLQMVTLSFGVVSLMPTAGQRVEDLVQMADQALYEAKAKGRNQVVTWPINR